MKLYRLSALRKALGETQAEAAAALGLSKSNYYLKEKGVLSFSREDLLRIICRYRLTKDEFWDIFFEEDINRYEMMDRDMEDLP